MLNIIMFGPPGSGKGTQSKKIAEQFGLKHLSTGEMLRYEMDKKTKIGEKIRAGMDNGEYVSDELAVQLIKNSMGKNKNAKGFVFDGFPRTQAQAIILDKALARINTKISLAVLLQVPDVELIRRLSERAKISGRGEDQGNEMVQKRLGIYNTKTKPIMDYYKGQNKLVPVDGSGFIDDISKRIHQCVVGLYETGQKN
ncbi:MAG: adenylate kinase [Bacteroidetes bacterium 4572_117]|nr:MAG: adenylate kinase [Bacteroidetes bacterium 4572_117]